MVDPVLLQPVAAQLQHRGPDGLGYFASGPVGLVHTRLSIIDLSGGQQPIRDDETDLALIANGEIYNHIELRDEFEQAGRLFTTHSDSETILHAYALDRERFVERLHGMFAFAIFDGRRQTLILGRDRLGIKPLFYCCLPNRFVFASEIKALLPLIPHSPAIDADALSQFLHNQFSTGRDTILSGIKRVEPGEIIEVDTSLTPRHRRYWTPLSVHPLHRNMPEAKEEFSQLFRRVMTEHLRADVPCGLFLSGGNDSAILLSELSQLQSQPVRTFSIGYVDSSISDELHAAEAIATRFGSRHTSLRLDRSAVFRRIPHSIWAADELMRDYACLPSSALAEAAGFELKVVFTGEGGDEVFAGYGRYRQHPLLLLFKSLWEHGSGGFRTRSQWRARGARRLLGPELAERRAAFREPVTRAWAETPPAWSHLQRCQYTDLVTALPDNLLVKADRMLMAFGLEGRVPFLDHRIVEFGLSLPDPLKVKGRQTKVLLRKWAERSIPPSHLYHRKRGFHVPVGQWLRGSFLDRLETKLRANRAIREWFDVSRLTPLFQDQRQRQGASREIFSLMQFAIWHHLVIDRPGTKPSPNENPLDFID